jgi:hypothetical protein
VLLTECAADLFRGAALLYLLRFVRVCYQCIYAHTYISVSIYTSTHVHTYISVSIWGELLFCISCVLCLCVINTYTHIRTYLYQYIQVHTYIHTYLYPCIPVHTHTHTHTHHLYNITHIFTYIAYIYIYIYIIYNIYIGTWIDTCNLDRYIDRYI